MWHIRTPIRRGRQGSALLAVLWLTAALSAIAFSIATTVRGETERSATAVDAVRAHYLASGAIERALFYMQWAPSLPQQDGKPRFTWGTPSLSFDFATGHADVRIIPESSKINVNMAPPEELYRLLTALGADPGRAGEIVGGILERRLPNAPSSFPGRQTSFQEIEDLMQVKGMTPELFYGSYERGEQGQLIPRTALKDCVTVYGMGGAVDVNTAVPAVMIAAGLPPELASVLVDARSRAPFTSMEQVSAIVGSAPGANRLRLGGYAMFTLVATARLRLPDGTLSEERRSVAALVKFLGDGFDDRYHVLRWYDDVWVQ